MKKVMSKIIIPPINIIANSIKMPDLKTWKGKCYEIASIIVNNKIIDDNCRAVYGHYLGFISLGSYFKDRRLMPFIPHGWIVLSNGDIIDPTRWVFEARKPYIAFIDRDDDIVEQYDEGGNKWREQNVSPAPKFDKTERCFPIVLNNEECREYFNSLLSDERGEDVIEVSFGQMFWIANLSLFALGIYAKDVFTWIRNMGLNALIPIDNQMKIFGK